eukprot:scpid37979/ scgid23126/ Arylsulfatase G
MSATVNCVLFSVLLHMLNMSVCTMSMGRVDNTGKAVHLQSSPPNMVVMLADDFGWGDVGAYWPSATEDTPNIDKLAESGIKLLDFHSAASVCAPSRASLLTGRIGLRNGVIRNFEPASIGGLPLAEVTLAEQLKDGDYQTGMIGKWHLGMHGPYHPLKRGFDFYYGLPYSNDMGCTDYPGYNLPMCKPCPQLHRDSFTSLAYAAPLSDSIEDKENMARISNATSAPIDCDRWNDSVPLFDGYNIVEQPVDLRQLAQRYEESTERFLDKLDTKRPFLLYVAFAHMHVPQQHSDDFINSSKKGTVFADTLREMDHLVGEIMSRLAEKNFTNNTLVWFTGDNGPWDRKCNLTGSSGPFVGQWQQSANGGGGGATMKTTTWEGGHREVGIVSWPGHIQAGSVSNALTSTLDIMPTLIALAGLKLPDDRQYDGLDISNLLLSESTLVGASSDTLSASWIHNLTYPKYRIDNGGMIVQQHSFQVDRHRNDFGHDHLFHPNSGVGKHGLLQTVRLGQYKVRYILGSSLDCLGRSVPTSMLETPQLFDLAVDPAESSPLNVTEHTAIIMKAKLLLSTIMYNISVDKTSRADFSLDQSIRPCCDAKNPVCRCTTST